MNELAAFSGIGTIPQSFFLCIPQCFRTFCLLFPVAAQKHWIHTFIRLSLLPWHLHIVPAACMPALAAPMLLQLIIRRLHVLTERR